jgi:hypothetical protein
MELIKTPSFMAMENLSEMLFPKTKNITLEQLHKKVADYLVNFGSKKFVELYNDVAKNKNYKQAFTTLNL